MATGAAHSAGIVARYATTHRRRAGHARLLAFASRVLANAKRHRKYADCALLARPLVPHCWRGPLATGSDNGADACTAAILRAHDQQHYPARHRHLRRAGAAGLLGAAV